MVGTKTRKRKMKRKRSEKLGEWCQELAVLLDA